MVARSWKRRKCGVTTNEHKAYFCGNENALEQRWWLHNSMKALKTTEMNTSKSGM